MSDGRPTTRTRWAAVISTACAAVGLFGSAGLTTGPTAVACDVGGAIALCGLILALIGLRVVGREPGRSTRLGAAERRATKEDR